uniref:F-box associated domain-containing protein n=1 Tax=Leersia perrieri TaxID=77586 RepID=A0A0D9WWK2_9ORYZ
MSGNVLKRIPIVKLSIGSVCCRHALTSFASLPVAKKYDRASNTYAFGLVASAAHYKMVCIVHLDLDFLDPSMHLCEVMILDESNHRTWRRKQCDPVIVSPGHTLRREGFMNSVVVYFMMDAGATEPAGVDAFSLETEERMPTIRGPESLQRLVGDEHYTRATSD